MDTTTTSGGCLGIILFFILVLFGSSFFLVQTSDVGEVAPTPSVVVTAVAPPVVTAVAPPAEYTALTEIVCGDRITNENAEIDLSALGLFATVDIAADSIFTGDDLSVSIPDCG